MKIILATHNLHKRKELQDVLQERLPGVIELLTIEDVPELSTHSAPEETGSTLEENALIKARDIFDRTQIPTIADDTGLEVTALNGAPGVYSARYAGESASYSDNVNKLLVALKTERNRSAKFRTVLCYISPDSSIHYFSGEIEGRIATSPRGPNGFGYDPIFIPDDDMLHRTFGEMSEFEKNRISHRALALRQFVGYLLTSDTK